jgi:hypothetical protein
MNNSHEKTCGIINCSFSFKRYLVENYSFILKWCLEVEFKLTKEFNVKFEYEVEKEES